MRVFASRCLFGPGRTSASSQSWYLRSLSCLNWVPLEAGQIPTYRVTCSKQKQS